MSGGSLVKIHLGALDRVCERGGPARLEQRGRAIPKGGHLGLGDLEHTLEQLPEAVQVALAVVGLAALDPGVKAMVGEGLHEPNPVLELDGLVVPNGHYVADRRVDNCPGGGDRWIGGGLGGHQRCS